MRDFAEHLSEFSPNKLNKFKNAGARMQCSIYHMPLNLHLIIKAGT